MLIQSIRLHNLLSFGANTGVMDLAPLNVLIGPNGSGKSNLIEAIGLLQATPTNLASSIRQGGGVGEWIWKGEEKAASAQIEVAVENPKGSQSLRYRLGFAEKGQCFELIDEGIENAQPLPDCDQPSTYFAYQDGAPYFNVKETGRRTRQREEFDPEKSILAQRKEPYQYPELTYLGEEFDKIRLYREWTFGRYNAPCLPQTTDLPNGFLSDDSANLAPALNRLKREPKAKAQILDSLSKFYEGISDFDVIIEGGTVQVFLQEGDITLPATRLSDGTLRYLCLLAILCHPEPPPLVCIEEPELGSHPDILPTLSDLLRDASERCQLAATTHSDVLVDALTNTPDSVVVFEKRQGQTRMRRLDKAVPSDWLERYSLGGLRSMGELGGNRW